MFCFLHPNIFFMDIAKLPSISTICFLRFLQYFKFKFSPWLSFDYCTQEKLCVIHAADLSSTLRLTLQPAGHPMVIQTTPPQLYHLPQHSDPARTENTFWQPMCLQAIKPGKVLLAEDLLEPEGIHIYWGSFCYKYNLKPADNFELKILQENLNLKQTNMQRIY